MVQYTNPIGEVIIKKYKVKLIFRYKMQVAIYFYYSLLIYLRDIINTRRNSIKFSRIFLIAFLLKRLKIICICTAIKCLIGHLEYNNIILVLKN